MPKSCIGYKTIISKQIKKFKKLGFFILMNDNRTIIHLEHEQFDLREETFANQPSVSLPIFFSFLYDYNILYLWHKLFGYHSHSHIMP